MGFSLLARIHVGALDSDNRPENYSFMLQRAGIVVSGE